MITSRAPLLGLTLTSPGAIYFYAYSLTLFIHSDADYTKTAGVTLVLQVPAFT